MEFTLSFVWLFFWSIYLVAPLLVFFIFLITALGQVVCSIEKWRRFDGLYWAFITATTVGYGDIRPLRKVSKALSVLIAIIGMMFTGVIIAVTLNTTSVVIEKYVDESTIEKLNNEFN